MIRPHGIVFCGQPGTFSVWTVAPNGMLMDREHVELVGQLAARAGATDYRVFELDISQLTKAMERSRGMHGETSYLSAHHFSYIESLLLASRGVPEESQ
jgi:hypothetical protein